MTQDLVQELLDKQACVELVYRLARAIDRCDETLLRSLFHADATDDHGVFHGTAADFADWVMPVLLGMKRTQHCIANVLIEVRGDTAFGESYFIAHHALPNAQGPDTFMVAAGRYLDRFERRAGEWRIVHRHAVYEWTTHAPASDPLWSAPPLVNVLTRGRRNTGDPSYANLAWLGGSV